MTLLPMTRRHDAVGTANWPAQGGAVLALRCRYGHGAAIAPDRVAVDLIDNDDQSAASK